MKTITCLPRCYNFSFDIETMTLFLKIQKWIALEIQKLLRAETGLMENYMYKTYGGDKKLFANFGEKGQSFGYDNSILWHQETDDEIIYAYTLRPVIEQTEKLCERCHGTKIDFLSHPCNECRQTGKKHIGSKFHFSQGLLSLYPIVKFANIALLESYLEKDKRQWNPQTNKKQLVAIEWSDTTGRHNCSMVAWVDNIVSMWIKVIPNHEVEGVALAMHKTEEILLLRKIDKNYFRFERYGDDLFSLQVPGNACSLDISSHGMGMFGCYGKTLQPHNIDHRFQQMEFIVGLAVINDLIEKYEQKRDSTLLKQNAP